MIPAVVWAILHYRRHEEPILGPIPEDGAENPRRKRGIQVSGENGQGELWALLSAREQQPASLHVGIIDAGPPRGGYYLFPSLSRHVHVCVETRAISSASSPPLYFTLRRRYLGPTSETGNASFRPRGAARALAFRVPSHVYILSVVSSYVIL